MRTENTLATQLSVILVLVAVRCASAEEGVPSRRDSRLRTFTGITYISDPVYPDKRLFFPILSFNYRWSRVSLQEDGKAVQVGITSELGLDYLVFVHFKLGPEMRVNRSLYFYPHLGAVTLISVILSPPSSGNFAAPFAGLDVGVIRQLSRRARFELELGSVVGLSGHVIPYLAVGFGLKPKRWRKD